METFAHHAGSIQTSFVVHFFHHTVELIFTTIKELLLIYYILVLPLLPLSVLV